MNRDTNINTKWFGKGVTKSKKEKKVIFSVVGTDNSELVAINKYLDEERGRKKALQDDKTTINRLNNTSDKIAELAVRQEVIDNIVATLKSNVATIAVPAADEINDSPVTDAGGATIAKTGQTKSILEIWKAFEKRYIGKIGETGHGWKTALRSLKDLNIKDNLYKFTFNGQTYQTNESTGAERIAYELCHQLAKLDESKVTTDGTGARSIPSTSDFSKLDAAIAAAKTTGEIKSAGVSTGCFETTLGDITWLNDLKRLLRLAKEVDLELTRRTPKLNPQGNAPISNWGVEYSEFAEGNSAGFNFDSLHNLIRKLWPQGEDGVINFLDSKLSENWGNELKFSVKKVEKISQEAKTDLIKKGYLPEFYNEDGIDVYWNLKNDGEVIKFNGIRGYFELYNSFFDRLENRTKFTKTRDFSRKYDVMVEQLIYQRLVAKDKWTVLAGRDNNHYIAKIENNFTGEIEKFAINYNVYQTIAFYKDYSQRTKTGKETLEKGELTKQSSDKNEHDEKIAKIDAKIGAKESEYVKLLIKEAKEKQKAVETLKTDLVANNVDWNKKEIILKAAKVEKYILDISWIQSEGLDGSKETKEDEKGKDGECRNLGITADQAEKNNNLLFKIEQERIRLGQAWHVIIKGNFDEGGTSLETRIDKARKDGSKGGIGLEVFLESFRFLNETATVGAIEEEILKETTASNSPNLTAADLNNILEITDATVDMANEWSDFGNDGWGKDKNNIKKLIEKYNTDAAKKKLLLEYVAGLTDDKFKPVRDSADEEAKFIAFKKLKPEQVIRSILEYENKAALENDGAERSAIVVRMKETGKTGYDNDDTKNFFKQDRYGNPNESKSLTKEQISNFLLDEETKNINKQDKSWAEQKEGTRNGRTDGVMAHLKKHWYWYALALIVGIILIIVIFWKNLSEWWNGPAEEGSEIDKNQEEDNE